MLRNTRSSNFLSPISNKVLKRAKISLTQLVLRARFSPGGVAASECGDGAPATPPARTGCEIDITTPFIRRQTERSQRGVGKILQNILGVFNKRCTTLTRVGFMLFAFILSRRVSSVATLKGILNEMGKCNKETKFDNVSAAGSSYNYYLRSTVALVFPQVGHLVDVAAVFGGRYALQSGDLRKRTCRFRC
jgi:hypothetical protein